MKSHAFDVSITEYQINAILFQELHSGNIVECYWSLKIYFWRKEEGKKYAKFI